MFNVEEYSIKVYLLEDIKCESMLETISEVVDRSFTKNSELSKFHEMNVYKDYVFSGLYPIEKSKTYFKGKIYTFKIRTINKNMCRHFENILVNEYTKKMKILTIDKKIVQQKVIDKIYSITPCIEKFEDGYWKKNHSLDEFEKRLKVNLIKKYKQILSKDIDEDFELFTFIRIDNKKPIGVKYKNIRLLGDKITLKVADNSLAQKIAYLSLGIGICEMNGRGFGYVNYRFL